MKILIAVPMPDAVAPAFISNLIGIVTKTMRDFPDDEVFFAYKTGVRTDKNRNVLIQRAMENDVDYILWLDADMIYPLDIVSTYMKEDFDIIGCLYFKRLEPYDPIAYIKNPDTSMDTPWLSLSPAKLPQNTVLEVDGLGFGGVMVRKGVYEGMGEDRWMYYDKGFHLPYKNKYGSTHDLVFCRNAQKHGFTIKLHTGVKPGHLAEKVVTEEDWKRFNA